MPGAFEIDGEQYEIPALDTITLDEERILYLHADIVLADFAPPRPDVAEELKEAHAVALMTRIRNPAFKTALAYIAYRRKHPEVEAVEISNAIGTLVALELDLVLLGGDDENPPDQSSPSESSSKSEIEPLTREPDSGPPTGNGSAQVDESPEPTGTSESGMSSPGAARIELVS